MDELESYLEEKEFDYSDYSTPMDGSCLFWHHEKCEDILALEKGNIIIYSLPSELINMDLGLTKNSDGHEIIKSKDDIDMLCNLLDNV